MFKENSGISIRFVNSVFAGEDVRYSAVEAVELNILIYKKHSA